MFGTLTFIVVVALSLLAGIIGIAAALLWLEEVRTGMLSTGWADQYIRAPILALICCASVALLTAILVVEVSGNGLTSF